MARQDDLLTPDQAAEVLKIAPAGVRYLIRTGRLKATRFGRGWAIRRADLARIEYGTPGRPKTATK